VLQIVTAFATSQAASQAASAAAQATAAAAQAASAAAQATSAAAAIAALTTNLTECTTALEAKRLTRLAEAAEELAKFNADDDESVGGDPTAGGPNIAAIVAPIVVLLLLGIGAVALYRNRSQQQQGGGGGGVRGAREGLRTELEMVETRRNTMDIEEKPLAAAKRARARGKNATANNPLVAANTVDDGNSGLNKPQPAVDINDAPMYGGRAMAGTLPARAMKADYSSYTVAPQGDAVYYEPIDGNATQGTDLLNDTDYDMPSGGAATAPLTTSATIYADYAPGMDNGAAYTPVDTDDVLCARGTVPGGKPCTHIVGAAALFCPNHTCNQAGCFNAKSSSAVACNLHGARLFDRI
jgi:hypothetical protein